jgi:hypothetical protein
MLTRRMVDVNDSLTRAAVFGCEPALLDFKSGVARSRRSGSAEG